MHRIALKLIGLFRAIHWRVVISPIAFALLVALGVRWLALDSAWARSGDRDRNSIRVMTLNVAHGRAMARTQAGIARADIERNLDRVAKLVRDVGPDVVAMQEADGPSTWSGGFSHVEYVAEETSMPGTCHGHHFTIRRFPVMIQYGAALLSTGSLSDCQSVRFKMDRWDTKGFVRATMTLDDRTVTVVSVHLDYRSAERRMVQARMMVDDLRTVDGPLIVLGDFNSDGREGDSLRFACDALNLSRHAPDSTVRAEATYPANEPLERIDWILISDAFRFVGHQVCDSVVSDHRAVWADIVWR